MRFCLIAGLPGFEDLRAEAISRQLRAWADSLQNSDIRGQRYLSDKTRRSTKEAREREEFLKELEAVKAKN